MARQCTAKAKKTGNRCKRAPIPGGTVCVMHGGAAPQVRNAATRRIIELRDLASGLLVKQLRAGEVSPRTALATFTAMYEIEHKLDDRAAMGQSHADVDRFLEELRGVAEPDGEAEGRVEGAG